MEDIAKLVADMNTSEQAKQYRARIALTNLANHCANEGAPIAREALAQALAEQFAAENVNKDDRGRESKSPKYNPATRRQVLRILRIVATPAEVPTLLAGTEDLDVREECRCTLEQIEGEAATQALIRLATEGLGPELRIGAINSLAKRRDGNVVEALKECAADDNPDIRIAAADALSHQADISLDAVIVEAYNGQEDGPYLHGNLPQARLQLASTLYQANQADTAKHICKAVLSTNPPAHIQRAANHLLNGNQSA